MSWGRALTSQRVLGRIYHLIDAGGVPACRTRTVLALTPEPVARETDRCRKCLAIEKYRAGKSQ